MWASFAPTAIFTTPAAAQLVAFAQIRAGEAVLDVATGTGVVAVTAARAGALVTGIDLTPELLIEARENARIARQTGILWHQGDVERLPYPDGSFDVVLSQFGHMFAPRPEFAIAEMRRVLKPTGRVAFATWPPEHLIGQILAFVERRAKPRPPGAAPPPQWGIPSLVTERLAPHFGPPFFARRKLVTQALSVEHFRDFMEHSAGPIVKLVAHHASRPDLLAALRAEFDALASPYFADNLIHQDYLLTRAPVRWTAGSDTADAFR